MLQTKPNFDPRASLKYNLFWIFLYSRYRLSVFSNNIMFCKIDVILNKIKVTN